MNNVDKAMMLSDEHATAAHAGNFCSASRDALRTHLEAMEADRVRLLEALKVLASIPVEDFGKEDKPNHPLMAWNGFYLHVSDVIKARAAIAQSEAQS